MSHGKFHGFVLFKMVAGITNQLKTDICITSVGGTHDQSEICLCRCSIDNKECITEITVEGELHEIFDNIDADSFEVFGDLEYLPEDKIKNFINSARLGREYIFNETRINNWVIQED